MSNRVKREDSIAIPINPGSFPNQSGPQSTVVSTASSNLSGSNDFVKKLFQMLQDVDYKDVVRWTHTGDSFVVVNTNEFTKDVLPRHFKHSNFASFVRQLNKYDFHKVKISNEEKISYPYGDDAWEFKHPDFKMNDRDSLENIKRKGTGTKKSIPSNTSLGSLSTDNQTINSGPNIGCNHNYNQLNTSQAYLKDQVDRLKIDNKSLYQQINILETKYKSLIENIVTINSFNERNHDSTRVLLNCLVQAGIKLPPMDFPNPSLMSLQAPRVRPPQPSLPGHLPIAPNGGTFIPRPTPPSDSVASPPLPPGIPSAQFNNIRQLPHVVPLPDPTSQLPVATTSRNSSATNTNGTTTTTSSTGAITTSIPNPKFHVLLVEDDNVCIQLCRKFLVKYGCEVTVVTDGLNAISTVEHTKYDLVLMDIVMPNLDGATATSVIRSFDTKTPIIAMTGNIAEYDLQNYLNNGMLDILAKPFTKDDLYNILEKHLLHNENALRVPQRVQMPQRVVAQAPVATLNTPILLPEAQILKKPRLQ